MGTLTALKRIPATVVATAALILTIIHPARGQGTETSAQATQGSIVTRQALSAKRLSFYEVPLVCPAAPQIGCGSASRPILLGLESQSSVSQAWLNRAGTVIAVVWAEGSAVRDRGMVLRGVLKESGISAKELKGAPRKQALKSFQSESGWYRGAEVDRLSEEEAGVMATRRVGKIQEKVALSPDKVQALREGFTGALKRRLISQASREDTKQEMLKICREHLDEKEMAVLLDAFRPQLESPTNSP
jgi:hypothetical protein